MIRDNYKIFDPKEVQLNGAQSFSQYYYPCKDVGLIQAPLVEQQKQLYKIIDKQNLEKLQGPILKYKSYLSKIYQEYQDFGSDLYKQHHDILKLILEELGIFTLRLISKLTYVHNDQGLPQIDPKTNSFMYNPRILEQEAKELAFDIEQDCRELIKQIVQEKYAIPNSTNQLSQIKK